MLLTWHSLGGGLRRRDAEPNTLLTRPRLIVSLNVESYSAQIHSGGLLIGYFHHLIPWRPGVKSAFFNLDGASRLFGSSLGAVSLPIYALTPHSHTRILAPNVSSSFAILYVFSSFFFGRETSALKQDAQRRHQTRLCRQSTQRIRFLGEWLAIPFYMDKGSARRIRIV